MNTEEFNNQQKNIVKILMMPIQCNSKKSGIYIKDGILFTGQKYKRKIDADMSDVAVKFYEILYQDSLEGKILLDGDSIANIEFAGDTMSSYTTIARMFNEEIKGSKTSSICLSEFEDYYKQYHCLANFWLLPMMLGRRSPKRNQYDSVGIFIGNLSSKYENYAKEFSNYFSKFTYESFMNMHCVDEDYIRRNCSNEENLSDRVRNMYKNRETKTLLLEIKENIAHRAEVIANSDKAKDLWRFFSSIEGVNIDASQRQS